MSESAFAFLFLLGVLMIAGGLLCQWAAGGISDINADVASSLALLVVFSFLLLQVNSFEELLPLFEGIVGGVPFAAGLADFGSLQAFFTQAPGEALLSFLDLVILSALIEVIQQLFAATGSYARKGTFSWINLFTGVISALMALAILNYGIKKLPLYAAVTSAVGLALSTVSLSTLVMLVLGLAVGRKTLGSTALQALISFSKTSVGKALASSFFKAVLYVFGIWIMQTFFPTIQSYLSDLLAWCVALVPSLIVLVGIFILLKSVFR